MLHNTTKKLLLFQPSKGEKHHEDCFVNFTWTGAFLQPNWTSCQSWEVWEENKNGMTSPTEHNHRESHGKKETIIEKPRGLIAEVDFFQAALSLKSEDDSVSVGEKKRELEKCVTFCLFFFFFLFFSDSYWKKPCNFLKEFFFNYWLNIGSAY